MIKYRDNDSGLQILELEITRKCNLNCKHCYVGGHQNTVMEPSKVYDLINQGNEMGVNRLVFTGGEPLLDEHLFDYAEHARKIGYPETVLLTNGILVSKENVEKLKVFDVVQLSLDGTPAQNGDLRVNYIKQLEKTVNLLKSSNINVLFYVTIHKTNISCIEDLINYAQDLRCRIAFNVLIPLKKELEPLVPSPKEIKIAFAHIVERAKTSNTIQLSHHLRFLIDEERRKELEILLPQGRICGGCMAGIAAAYVNVFGELYSCPFLQVTAGNVFEKNLSDIWENSEFLTLLRNRKKFLGPCGNCKYTNACGGCRAMSYIKYGTPFASDANCFKNIKNNYSIRKAQCSDAPKITEIHCATWQDAYKDIIDSVYLHNRVVTPQRIDTWINRLEAIEQGNEQIVLVAESYKKDVVAFVWGGKKRDNFAEADYEVYAIYVQPQFQGDGIGSLLLQNFAKEIDQKNFYLYVLDGNKSELFYQKMAGLNLSQYNRYVEIGEQKLWEKMYLFESNHDE